jgi:predicted metal-dependent peptidase
VIRPKRMTVVLFDAKIQKVYEFKPGDEFARIEIVGRGGNDMNCVADWLDACDPPATAAIIFADMQFDPMRKLKHDIPVLWINSGLPVEPPYGEIIRIHVKHNGPPGR